MGFIPENVIVNLKKEIAASGGAAVEELTTRVQTLETTVGDETGGLVKDVDDLETVVGDSSSGLVKDVDDLETVVGDSESGLVKSIADMGLYSGTEAIVGTWGTVPLYRKIVNMGTITAGSSKSVASGISNIVIRKISGIAATSGYSFPVPYLTVESDTVNFINISYNKSDNTVNVLSSFANFGDGTCWVFLEYTKNPTP